MTDEQKKHIEECTTKASTKASQAIEELIDEFDNIITNNPDDDELCLDVQKKRIGCLLHGFHAWTHHNGVE